MAYIAATKNQNMDCRITKTTMALALSALVVTAQAQGSRLGGATVVSNSGLTNLPYFIKLNPGQTLRQESFTDWAVYALNVPSGSTFKAYQTEKDELGYTHTRYRQYVNGYSVEGSMVIAHAANGNVSMVNGDYFQEFSSAGASLTEQAALALALKKVHADKYMWENKQLESMEREATNNPSFTYYPKGELVYVHKNGADFSAASMRLAYKFNVYAEVPLYRANVFVDASTGEILDEQTLICTADVVGTAVTKYSGTVSMTCDNASGPYRLRESGRGNGIQTYNLQNTTNYAGAVDFTNGSSSWTNTGFDQAATDAHWGAEKTYDYYFQKHNRNSIDNAGYMLRSYVHYSTSYVNAFWNGQYMTYGDGNGTSYTIMTALDVCGHEITHGLTSATANLAYSYESGALNEAFSDIFGNTIENFARPTQWSWKIGEDITGGSGLRSMSNPNAYGNPDTYNGTYWYTGTSDNGGVHTNRGVANYWYYLLVNGGSGTNDNSVSYNVSGIGFTSAAKIAYRGLTTYFTSSTNYLNARTLTEQAAVDLFGNCSPELTSTSNAWYAVGVGTAPTTGAPLASFSTGSVGCSVPATINFTNTSTGSQSYSWNFGDGGTSTSASPSHTYNTAGTYTVTLVATGCGGSLQNTTTQVVNIGAGAPLPLSEGFEANASLPGGWTLYNPDADAAWQINTTVAKTGTNCIGFNNCDGDGSTDMTGRVDRFYIKNYNFSNVTSASLTFDIAYAQLIYQGTPYSDQLKVMVSTNCGSTWSTLYNKSGATLASAPSYTSIASCWQPTSTQWRNDNVSLTSVIGAPSVMIAFENTSAWGTWVYLDNINITGTTGIPVKSAEGVSVYPNPAHNNFTVNADENINSIIVLDMLGKTVLYDLPAGEKTAQLDVSALPSGVYFVKVSAGDAHKLIKLLKE